MPSLEGDGYFRLEPEEVPESFRIARENFKRSFNKLLASLASKGMSPLEHLVLVDTCDRATNGWGADFTWFDDVTNFGHSIVFSRGIPRQEVNLSPEAMGLVRDALDDTLEYYGTSGDLESRGFWMKCDGDAS